MYHHTCCLCVFDVCGCVSGGVAEQVVKKTEKRRKKQTYYLLIGEKKLQTNQVRFFEYLLC